MSDKIQAQLPLFRVQPKVLKGAFGLQQASKQLKIGRMYTPTSEDNNALRSKLTPQKRKLRLSSNLLIYMGFDPEQHARGNFELIGPGAGLRFSYDVDGSHKVHERSYHNRSNVIPANYSRWTQDLDETSTPVKEALIECSNQTLLDEAFGDCTHVRVLMTMGEVRFLPCFKTPADRARVLHAKSDTPLRTGIVCTGGVDAHLAQRAGAEIDTIIEYRPHESRDKDIDKTETGVISALHNATIRNVVNVDLYDLGFNPALLVETFKDAPYSSLYLTGLVCDSFSNLQPKKHKTAELEHGKSFIDMWVPFSQVVALQTPAVVMMENVPDAIKPENFEMFRQWLLKAGYHISTACLNAQQYGGYTTRERSYVVASAFPGFKFPEPTGPHNRDLWRLVLKHIEGCKPHAGANLRSTLTGVREGTGKVQERKASFLQPGMSKCPTIVKSQHRYANDSIYIGPLSKDDPLTAHLVDENAVIQGGPNKGEPAFIDGKQYKMPSRYLVRELQGLPESFNCDVFGEELSIEIMGQAVDVALHEAVMHAVFEHLKENHPSHASKGIAA